MKPHAESGPATDVADEYSRAPLRDLLHSSDITFMMEAHDALSARIAQNSGFAAIWTSGLSISAALGYRDANVASWTEVVDKVERIVDATGLPVLVDGDSSFDNAPNARLAVRRLWQRGAAGLCLEHQQFPKVSAFAGDRHRLADIGEFCGHLKAVKDTIGDRDFVLVARIEALITGQRPEEALSRAHAYAEAGADAVLINSRRSVADEILDFARVWQSRLPVVIVPTNFYNTPVAAYCAAGISTVIWTNHSMRAAVAAMRDICAGARRENGMAGVESKAAGREQAFRLLDYAEVVAEVRSLTLGPCRGF
jgi:phosphoenolpyruvate phosphomutase